MLVFKDLLTAVHVKTQADFRLVYFVFDFNTLFDFKIESFIIIHGTLFPELDTSHGLNDQSYVITY